MAKDFDFSELEKLKKNFDNTETLDFEDDDYFEDNENDMVDEQKEQKRFLLRIRLAIAAVVLAVIAVGAYYAYSYSLEHIYIAGKFYDVWSSSLDLRGKPISLQEYRELTEKYPQYKILWDVPIQGKSYTSTISKITVTSLTEDDVEAMAYLPKLRQVNADDCKDYALLQKIIELYPRVRVSYRVQIGVKEYPPTLMELDVSRKTTEDLIENLAYMPELIQVNFTDALPDETDMKLLEEKYPKIIFYGLNADGIPVQRSGNPASTVLDNKVYSLSDTVLNLTGAALSSDEKLVEKIGLFSDLKVVCLQGTDLNEAAIQNLEKTYPNIKFLRQLAFGDVQLSASAKTVDISGQKMESVSEFEEMLPFFPEATKVVMSDCGISDTEMDLLNKRYEDIEFVWSVKLNNRLSVRTDERVFSIGNNTTLKNDDLYPLRYCTNMLCVDISRMSNVTSIDWAAFMPELTFLVISETKVSDLSPLNGLRKLTYLEMYKTNVLDYSPLVNCTSLHDLNIGWTYGDPEPIAEMKWVKNVYWGDCTSRMSSSGRAPAVLSLALPEANLVFSMTRPVEEGWRRLNNYYVMRDLMGLPYQDQNIKVSNAMLEKIAMVDGMTVPATTKRK